MCTPIFRADFKTFSILDQIEVNIFEVNSSILTQIWVFLFVFPVKKPYLEAIFNFSETQCRSEVYPQSFVKFNEVFTIPILQNIKVNTY